MSTELNIIRALVRPILENPQRNEWQVQGLGMLRTYLDKDVRLHIWDNRLNYCADSGRHTHPWDFGSFIVAGAVINTTYIENHSPVEGRMIGADRWRPFKKRRIVCGPDGCALSEDVPCFLWPAMSIEYKAGSSYTQSADEIHATKTMDGTISIISRKLVHADGSATIYTPADSEWSNAEARKATWPEIFNGCELALARLTQEEQS